MNRFPASLYHVYADFDGGLANWLDPRDSFVAALDDVAQALSTGHKPRVLRIDFDLETNLPETVTDLTDEMVSACMIAAE